MFDEEEDWSDEQDAQVLSESVLRNVQKKSPSSAHVKAKPVGKKSLLRTLQTLGSVPEWKNSENQQDSDSDTEAAPSQSKKKKKKRKHKRKQAETNGEQTENGDVDQTDEDEKLVAKKRKKDNKSGAQKGKPALLSQSKEEEKTQIIKAKIPEGTDGLNRQQWRNKMKRKKTCKNKYRQKNPEEAVNKAESTEEHKPKEEDSNNNKSEKVPQTPAKKKKTECKAQKRKRTQEEAEISCPIETQMLREVTGDKVEKGATESKQRAAEPKVEITDEARSPTARVKAKLSIDQSVRRVKLLKMLRQETVRQESPAEQKDEPDEPAVPETVELDRSASLRSRMVERLESGRFRFINEVLYSTTSGEARRMFKQDPQAFGIYHRGYTAQVQKWPSNPVDAIIAYIKLKPPSLVVADFGCGDCKIARSVKNKVHSFDLAATCELVTVCDMANVPLPDRSVDIAVFCLSLMGTNLADFLAEANRVLKMGGVLHIAEVTSRFENVRNFVTGLANLGFKMVSKDTENTHFFTFELVKSGNAPENVKKFGLELKPCVYKKR